LRCSTGCSACARSSRPCGAIHASILRSATTSNARQLSAATSGSALRWIAVYKALGRLEARDLRSLENAVRRQVQEMETAREQKAETLQDRIEVNKLDITLSEGSRCPFARR
jgi:hypothetical protein